MNGSFSRWWQNCFAFWIWLTGQDLWTLSENWRPLRCQGLQQPQLPASTGRPDERVWGSEEAQPQKHRQAVRRGGRGQCWPFDHVLCLCVGLLTVTTLCSSVQHTPQSTGDGVLSLWESLHCLRGVHQCLWTPRGRVPHRSTWRGWGTSQTFRCEEVGRVCVRHSLIGFSGSCSGGYEPLEGVRNRPPRHQARKHHEGDWGRRTLRLQTDRLRSSQGAGGRRAVCVSVRDRRISGERHTGFNQSSF